MQYQQQPNPYQGQSGAQPQQAQQPQAGYAQPGYQQQGYQQPGYQQPAYQQPAYAPPQQPVYGAAYGTPFPVVSGVRVPMLIAAIWHAICLLSTIWLVVTIVFAWVPLIVLLYMIFEFKVYGSLGGRTPPSHHRGGAQAMAILQIISILWLDVPALICGIIAISNLNKLQP